ncbi:WD40-repeat-containing domain protein [Fimicolochytrium jonesii]|uniref:WD40-repeat-containing domain protein n=1 Tax=Fimicolochytrium jonesii TaxID=1396493 RepID=UPI0022FEA257|nr:WD40-repeat-containing domain protein [Fimicolochytrium jonesii]KAI8819111.1 WD40-repeat-containing domain protein [Fimicolochytrium jonesii]
MAPPRKKTTLGFPVFAVTWTPSRHRVTIGGGGGPTKAGVKNAMILYDVDPNTLDVKPVTEQLFGKKDDGCMSIAVHPKEKAFVAGVNSPEEQMKAGQNENCRVFFLRNEVFTAKGAHKTLDSTDPFFHQKISRFTEDGKILVTGNTDGKLSIWTWPDFKPAIPPIDHKGEIVDADFSPDGKQLVSVTATICYVTDVSNAKTLWSIEKPVMKKTIKSEFRASRFGVRTSEGYLFLVINAKDRKRAFICKWQVKGWKLHRQKGIGSKPVTAFTISKTGALLAFGAADLSVNVISAKGLQTIYRIPNVHDFPLTALDFDPTGQILVSGSADGTVHVALVPPASGKPPDSQPLVAGNPFCTRDRAFNSA